jgi:hypothetical protein
VFAAKEGFAAGAAPRRFGGPMDRASELLLESLKQALAAAGEQRLYRSGKLQGLFPGRGGPSGAAAARAVAQGLLEVVRTETRGKTAVEWVRVTPRGVDFLHENESPVRALQELRAALRCNRQALPGWLDEMRGTLQSLGERLGADAAKWQHRLEALERRLEEALRRLEAAGPLLPREEVEAHPWAVDALNYLDRRRGGGAADDCPLPELFAAVARHHPGLSLGAFHDGLRRLHQRRALGLRPAAAGVDLPQPEYALPDAGGLLYYAAR